jgi:hypothetical protein
MNIHKFYPLQEPQPEEFDDAFVDTAYNLIKRFGAITQPGVVPCAKLYSLTGDARWSNLIATGQEFDITPNGAWAFNVGPGMAFSRNTVSSVGSPTDANNTTDLRMERIFISPADAAVAYADSAAEKTGRYSVDVLGNPTPKSSGCFNIPVQPSRVYYVYVKYLQCVDTQSTNPGTLGNNYSLNAQTGQVQYVHWADGYVVNLYNAISVDPDDVYIGMVRTDVNGIYDYPTSGRTYFTIPGSLITTRVSAALQPLSYVRDTSINLTDHVNSVADIDQISVINPHGTTIESIPGLVGKFGVFSDSPQSFFTDGIIDINTDPNTNRPGPFWGFESFSPNGGLRIELKKPAAGQAVAIDKYLYDNSSVYYSETYDPLTGTFSMVSNPQQDMFTDFPAGVTAVNNGYYLVYMEQLTKDGIGGAQIKKYKLPDAVPVLSVLEDPKSYLSVGQFPICIVRWLNWNTSPVFEPFLFDPQTRYTGAFKTWDVRRYGTISPTNISHERRAYSADPLAIPFEGDLTANNTIYSDHIKWIAQGPAMVVTTYPVVQAMVRKAGRIRRVMVFSDVIPTGGALGLVINIKINGVSSIFSTMPAMTPGRAGNTSNKSGVANTAVLMDITEQPPVGAGDMGRIDSTANHVNAGDRLGLFIESVGAAYPGGDDLLVTIYVE